MRASVLCQESLFLSPHAHTGFLDFVKGVLPKENQLQVSALAQGEETQRALGSFLEGDGIQAGRAMRLAASGTCAHQHTTSAQGSLCCRKGHWHEVGGGGSRCLGDTPCTSRFMHSGTGQRLGKQPALMSGSIV